MEDQMANETGAVTGKVMDLVNGTRTNPVVDALVQVYGPSRTEQKRPPGGDVHGQDHTDEKGDYLIENLVPGWYWVSCTAFQEAGRAVEIRAGFKASCDLALEVGLQLTGLLEDSANGGYNELDKFGPVETGIPIR